VLCFPNVHFQTISALEEQLEGYRSERNTPASSNYRNAAMIDIATHESIVADLAGKANQLAKEKRAALMYVLFTNLFRVSFSETIKR
jgi:hypothetical protein